MTTVNATAPIIVNAEGLKCPLPVLKLQKALDGLSAGTQLVVRATDENTTVDIPAVCRSDGHLVHRTYRDAGVFVFEIEKGRATAD